MSFIDGMILPVPAANKDAYRAHSEKSWPLFQKAGALAMRECWGEDLPEGQVTSMPMAVRLEPGETVVFSWIEWPDRATRDRGWAALMADEAFGAMMQQMPCDAQRMTWGGFAPLVDCH
ncbi:MAG: DUF1428 domain-containing protein [Rhodobacterales bacterium]|nr:DUF1428 domain-containing protein [Rhodobacterales bacterium]MDX5499373.1 DUF1428 domain-containing protein [Rhodobacterales bacterium]